ncbi:glycosyltransferase family 2 protein [Craterilacuibacter sp. RT1T]|uniref:glycosyltransferase family 2 protein n=1 Tax=Craterilacuibacter sp. RT1T TaxID=2942211 RepID=UPI0020BF80B3|nr:glycosyltransferase family 2 protein [Craterilacuibacter sp. RT1T]MCL6263675.1 glycosyltransferase family 2 protein [Craterilacuibacter sp. RT1T]
MKVYIVLAAYNGEFFISQQLDSIISQYFREWVLLIRDDGSSDSTLSIIDNYVKTDCRIKFVEDNYGQLGTAASFFLLSQHAYGLGADYVFFADQDDVWNLNKISNQICFMRQSENYFLDPVPVAVYCDLAVVDQQLKILHPSYMGVKKINYNLLSEVKNLIFENSTTGCALLVNRALLEKSLGSCVSGVIMHDWWFTLLAAAEGVVKFDSYVGVNYRQHERNQIGVNELTLSRFFISKLGKGSRKANKIFFSRVLSQAKSLRDVVSPSSKCFPFLDELSCLSEMGFLRRLAFVVKYKVRRRGFISTALLWCRILIY